MLFIVCMLLYNRLTALAKCLGESGLISRARYIVHVSKAVAVCSHCVRLRNALATHTLPSVASGCFFNAASIFHLASAEIATQCYSMDADLETTCRNVCIIWGETTKGENGKHRSCHSC